MQVQDKEEEKEICCVVTPNPLSNGPIPVSYWALKESLLEPISESMCCW